MAANDMNVYNTSSSAFRYQKVLEKGKPVHDKNDLFSIRHPAMALSQRAKIFSPFTAALKGYSDEIAKAETEALEQFSSVRETAEEYP